MMVQAAMINHKGARQIDVDGLEQLPDLVPTATWHPLGHAHVLRETRAGFERAGIEVTRQSLCISADDQKFFGVFDLKVNIEDGVRRGCSSINLAAGIRNSTDKSLRVGVCTGERVFVCDNLAFSGEMAVFRKHTPNVEADLPRCVDEAVANLGQYVDARRAVLNWYRDTQLDDLHAHHLLIKAIDNNCLRTRDMTSALESWRKPAHEEFLDRNLWSFYNAITAVNRQHFDLHADITSERTMNLNRMLATEYGMAVV